MRRQALARSARGRSRRPYRSSRSDDDLAGAAHAVRLLRDPARLRALDAGQILAVQRLAGNRAVWDALAADESVRGMERASMSFQATIPCGPRPDDALERPAARPGLAAADGASGGREASIEHPEPGVVVMHVPDAVFPVLDHKSEISGGNPSLTADEYGLTSWTAKVVDPAVAHDAAANVFNVSATIDCPIGWEIHSRGRTDVPDTDPPRITRGSWVTAASDLTPDLSDDNGRPPRTQFWARDLTERHEKYHAKDMVKYGKAAFELAGRWLRGKTANSEADARALLNKVPDQMTATLRTAFLPRAEHRAYGDGAPDYWSRAVAITRHGKAGGYAPRRR